MTRDVAASAPIRGYVSRRFTNTYTSGYYFSSELCQGIGLTRSPARAGPSAGLPASTNWTAGVCGTLFQSPVPAPSLDGASSSGPWRAGLQTPANHRRKRAMNEINYIPVLTNKGRPLAPCHPKRARSLVRAGQSPVQAPPRHPLHRAHQDQRTQGQATQRATTTH